MKYIIASDHGGFKLKEELKKYFENKGTEVIDLGPEDEDKTSSYAIQGHKLACCMLEEEAFGIGICGTGLGISYALNRHEGIRAARVTSVEDARLAKQHNNANALALGGRQLSLEEAIEIIEMFESTVFEGGRHEQRIIDIDPPHCNDGCC